MTYCQTICLLGHTTLTQIHPNFNLFLITFFTTSSSIGRTAAAFSFWGSSSSSSSSTNNTPTKPPVNTPATAVTANYGSGTSGSVGNGSVPSSTSVTQRYLPNSNNNSSTGTGASGVDNFTDKPRGSVKSLISNWGK